jgi:hypothetical protein
MRVYQNVFAYASYVRHLGGSIPASRQASFDTWHQSFVRDRYCSVHHLIPDGDSDVFLACNAIEPMQRAWASARGMPGQTPLAEIVLAQVEEHRSEVFYTQDPGRYGPDFLRRLPSCVRHRICWQSPPAPAGDLSSYDVVVNNFPTSLAEYATQGVRTAYFTPSYDPAMADLSAGQDRPIDVAFVGGYSRHHQKRAAVLEDVANLCGHRHVVFALDRSRLTRLAESPLGWLLPLARHRRPAAIRKAAVDPVFGRDMYRLFAQAKIVLNGAVDSAGVDRGNMRCFEALGCGALMLTDPGRYPEGMEDGETMIVYRDGGNVRSVVEALLSEPDRMSELAARGRDMLRARYSKQAQWQRFVSIVSSA